MPKVSVIMPVFNVESYLHEAIDSILGQTFSDYEFIIIDDGSTDSSVDIIRSYNEPRIRFFQNEINMGVAATLNRGLKIATGEYIARMDADDISEPERFAKQVMFMNENPDVAVLASNVITLGCSGSSWPTSEDHETLKVDLLFNCCLAHPTVMLRSDIIREKNLYYDVEYNGLEDYELWYRVSNVAQLACIQDELLCYRIHPNQVSKERNELFVKQYKKLKYRILSNLHINENSKGVTEFIDYCMNGTCRSKEEWINLREFIEFLIVQNERYRYYDAVELRNSLRGIIGKSFSCRFEKQKYLLKNRNLYGKTVKETMRFIRALV